MSGDVWPMESIHINPARNPAGYVIQYDRLEGKYYNLSTDLYLEDSDLKLFGLSP